jgi:lycopene beta-cyclase
MNSSTPDLLLVGGGLANSLIAWRLTQRRPEVRVAILEAGDRLGGNHTWSFHEEDLSAEQRAWMAPFIVHRWPGQHIRFPDCRRDFSEPYLSITSDRLHEVMVAAGRFELKSGVRVTRLQADAVVTDHGERLTAGAVIDGRGPGPSEGLVLGFQKFVGREVRLAGPHGLTVPTIMDATVDQHDGYRFVYLLPFSDDTVLIEDTRYSDGEALDPDELHAAIDRYAAARGWTVTETLRDEDGVLPILMACDLDRFWPADDPVARSGLRAGLFQPTTGYSLPQAVALADAIADAWPMDGAQLARFTRDFTRTFWKRTAFYRLLNRMLFRVGRPEHRYKVLQTFYSLPEPLVTNFYATKLTLRQKLRILVGKPLPILDALPMVRERRFLQREAQKGT